MEGQAGWFGSPYMGTRVRHEYIRKGMKLELKLDFTGRKSDVDMTPMGIPVGHFTTSGSWTATDDDVLLLVDMQVKYGTDRQSLIPWVRAVRKAASAKYGHTPGLKLVHDMWQHIVNEIDAGHIATERRVVYTTPLDTKSGR
jgi:hypothetical protein